MSDVLVLYAHPNPKRSRYNDHLMRAAAATAGVKVHDLYETYPNMHVHVAAEQEALRQATAVVLQFPVYWFSAPALLKEWQDSVLTKGFAFGPGGNALEGKPLMVVVSTGGSVASYKRGEAHGAAIEAYLAPFEQTGRFCGMKLVDPFVTHDVGRLTDRELDAVAGRYKERLLSLREDETA